MELSELATTKGSLQASQKDDEGGSGLLDDLVSHWVAFKVYGRKGRERVHSDLPPFSH